ncbi:MAG: glycosyltransferase [Acholeplasmatales bacterium]|nr:glycosyltransferase [Acholeplasmatales bacterium]
MSDNVLLCAPDVILYYDIEGNVYLDDLGWFDRFIGFTNNFYTLTKGEPVKEPNKLIRLNDYVNIKKSFFLPTNINGKINRIKSTYKVIYSTVKKFEKVFVRYQGIFVHWVCKAARKYHKVYLAEIGGVQWDAFWNHSVKGKIIAAPLELMCKQDILKADYVHYVTLDYLQKRYPTYGKHIGLSNVKLMDVDSYVLDNRISKIKQEKDNIIIGTAAAVDVKYKGQQYVMKAIKRLKDNGYTNFVYQLAGQGNNANLKTYACKLGIKKQVQFLGKLSHQSVFEWLDSIDIYIQPSLQEGLPRAMVEAMSRGLPCIGAKTAGIPELIEKKYVYRKTNMPERIEKKLLQISSKEESLLQAKNNFEHAKAYNCKNIESKRHKFYLDFFGCLR